MLERDRSLTGEQHFDAFITRTDSAVRDDLAEEGDFVCRRLRLLLLDLEHVLVEFVHHLAHVCEVVAGLR